MCIEIVFPSQTFRSKTSNDMWRELGGGEEVGRGGEGLEEGKEEQKEEGRGEWRGGEGWGEEKGRQQ